MLYHNLRIGIFCGEWISLMEIGVDEEVAKRTPTIMLSDILKLDFSPCNWHRTSCHPNLRALVTIAIIQIRADPII